jgi:amino acid transporter
MQLGSFAGEVNTPAKTFPRVIGLTLLLNTAAYIGPILLSYCLLPSANLWNESGFMLAARRTSPFIAFWIVTSAALSNVGKLCAGVASTSRMMWAMGSRIQAEGVTMQMLPRGIGKLSGRYQTPVNALVFQLTVGIALVRFDFSALVQIETLLNCLCLGLEVHVLVDLHNYTSFSVCCFYGSQVP